MGVMCDRGEHELGFVGCAVTGGGQRRIDSSRPAWRQRTAAAPHA